MKKTVSIFCIIIFQFIFFSCIDKEYDWDDLDRTGVLRIPPVMFGNIDTIYLQGLPEAIIPGGIPLPDWTIAKSDTIKGLFDGDAVRDFFFEGAGAVEISAQADIDMEISGITIELHCFPIDYEGNIINEVKIEKQTLSADKDQKLSVIIPSEGMRYMENAKDLGLIIVLKTRNAFIWIGEDDYIFIKNVIVKTGGYHIDF